MSKDKDPLLDVLQGQKDFGFEKDGQYEVEFVRQTPEGFGLYRKKEAHGGYSYWTDQYGVGTLVYDEGITNIMSVFDALDHLEIGADLWRHIGVVYGYSTKT